MPSSSRPEPAPPDLRVGDYTVLARLGSGIEIWELVGAAILLALFIWLEIVFLGRLFRASLLATGQKPGIKQLFNRLKSAS